MNFLVLPSATCNSIMSANGSVVQEAARACWMGVRQSVVVGGRLLTFSTFRVGAYSKLGA